MELTQNCIQLVATVLHTYIGVDHRWDEILVRILGTPLSIDGFKSISLVRWL